MIYFIYISFFIFKNRIKYERENFIAPVSCLVWNRTQKTENRKHREAERKQKMTTRHKKQNKSRIIYITERQNKEFF